MVQPLSAVSGKGKIYQRPPDIESHISDALKVHVSAVVEKATIESGSPGYLPSECLVYLIRDAGRRGDEASMNALIPCLFTRCENIVRSKYRDTKFLEQLCDDVIGGLADKIAEDRYSGIKTALDYFEVRFNSAFRTLAIDHYRRRKGEQKFNRSTFIQLPGESDSSDHQIVNERVSNALSTADAMLMAEALDQLPREQRMAFVLFHMHEYEIESVDSNAVTIATLLNVSGRTVRTYLRLARTALKRFSEEQ